MRSAGIGAKNRQSFGAALKFRQFKRDAVLLKGEAHQVNVRRVVFDQHDPRLSRRVMLHLAIS